jgi:hypothetical protein
MRYRKIVKKHYESISEIGIDGIKDIIRRVEENYKICGYCDYFKAVKEHFDEHFMESNKAMTKYYKVRKNHWVY